MARTIRHDFDGVVQAYEFSRDGQRIGSAYMLPAGADVPDGVPVPEHLLEPLAGVVLAGDQLGTFDPSQNNVHQVLAYLDGVPDDERRRVLALEVAGHGRKGILESSYGDLVPKVTAAQKKAAEKAAADQAEAERLAAEEAARLAANNQK